MGLRGSGPTKTLWPPLCAYLCVTHGKTKLVNVPGHLPWPLSGATGLSCSHGWGHCCMLTVHSHFRGIIHSLWIFETMKNTIYWLFPFVDRQERHIVGSERGVWTLLSSSSTPWSGAPWRPLLQQGAKDKGTGAYFCQEVFAKLRLTYRGKQQTLPDHINKPSLWARM